MKAMKVLTIAMCLVVGGMAWGYTTFNEAFDAGWAAYRVPNIASAQSAFSEALTLAANSAQKSSAHIGLGFVNTQKKDDAAAVASFTSGINEVDVVPAEKSVALFYRGNAYLRLKNVVAAKADFAAVVALNALANDVCEAYFHLGLSKDLENDLGGAATDFLNAASTKGKSETRLLAITKLLDRSLVNWLSLIDKLGTPMGDWTGWYCLGIAKLKSGKPMFDAALSFSNGLALLDPVTDVELSKKILARRNHDWFRITGTGYEDWAKALSTEQQTQLR